VTEIALAFGAGLLGGAHCVGMCGGFAVVAGAAGRHGWQFHAGRLAGYAALGAVAGLLGRTLDLGGAALGLHRLRFLAAAALLLLFGLAFVGILPRRWLEPGAGAAARLIAAIRRRGGRFGWLLLGLPIGLLPCGLLYPMYALAAATGSPGDGALVLFAFGLGTLPLLGGATAVLACLRLESRRRLVRAVGALMLVLSGWMLWRGVAATGPHASGPHGGAPAAPMERR
jgi:sulfite exporter TauE/SafE